MISSVEKQQKSKWKDPTNIQKYMCMHVRDLLLEDKWKIKKLQHSEMNWRFGLVTTTQWLCTHCVWQDLLWCLVVIHSSLRYTPLWESRVSLLSVQTVNASWQRLCQQKSSDESPHHTASLGTDRLSVTLGIRHINVPQTKYSCVLEVIGLEGSGAILHHS